MKELPKGINIVSISCGHSHALLLSEDGQIFSFGAGMYGQLGIGPDDKLLSLTPIPVSLINDSGDPVKHIACDSHFSICYTELGILYYWGMLNADDVEGIEWFPTFMNISLPKDLIEDDAFLYDFHLTDIQASFREVLAADSSGRIYHCDLNFSQTLKPYRDDMQKSIGMAHKLMVGRSLKLFVE